MIDGLIALAGVVFGAGMAWGVLHASTAALRKDLNGVGLKTRIAEESNTRAQANLAAALLASCPEEKRLDVAKLLKD